jgi:hypothetical protein
MVGQINNQTPTTGLAQDKKHVCMTFEKNLLVVRQILTHVSNPSRKPINEDTDVSQYFQREGPKSKEPKVIKFDYLVVLTRREKCQS